MSSLPLAELEGKYEILHKIKEGGMGAIYKVRHQLLHEVRVVKVMRASLEDNQEAGERFVREARNAIKLRHPNIAQLYDFSIDEAGTRYIVMEYIAGLSLQEILRRHSRLPIHFVVEIVIQSLRALDYLHRRGFVHRDISPDNVMVSLEFDGMPVTKLIDLGIAKSLGAESGLTQANTFLGKIKYAAPESLQKGSGQVDARSDLYSFGIVLYELLTGSSPIQGSDLSSYIAGHLFHPPVPFDVSDVEGRVPPAFRDIVMRALAKNAEERVQSAEEFIDAIRSLGLHGDRAELIATARELIQEQPEPQVGKQRAAGGTQRELDRHFAPRPSDGAGEPAPGSEPSATGPRPMPPESNQARIEALLAEADELVDAGDYAAALQRFDQAILLGVPADREPEVRQLRADIVVRQQRAEEIAEVVARAAALIDARQWTEAAELLRQAQQTYPGENAIHRLWRELADLEQEDRDRQFEALIASAREAIGDGRPADAIPCLQQALALGATEAGSARQLLEEARELQVRQDRDRRRAEALAALERAVAQHLPSADFGSANAALEEAARALGGADDPDLAPFRERIEESARRHDAAKTAIESAARAADEGDMKRAKNLLSDAPRDGVPAPLLAELEALRERVASWERQVALEGARRPIERKLAAGDLVGARALLEEKERSHGADGFTDLRARLETDERAAQQAYSAQLTSEGHAALSAARFEEAIGKLEEAVRYDADNRKAQTLLERAQSAVRELEEEQRRIAVRNEAVREIEESRSAGRARRALRALERAESELGADATLGTLRAEIEPEAQAEAARRRQLLLTLAGAAAVIAVLVLAVVWWINRPPPPPPAGALVIDARPWARVLTVTDAALGEVVYESEEAFTPLRLELPPGRYTVALVGPQGQPAEEEVEVRGRESSSVTPSFETGSPEEQGRALLDALGVEEEPGGDGAEAGPP
ncbi:MAG TPA: protein kinase [Thermoanaerobaculia bacterium]|nr:protein kinase [Thermoanaerobaculia bacterium]